MSNHLAFVVLFFSILFSQAACSSLEPDPAPDSGFLQKTEDMTSDHRRLPFQRSWIKSSATTNWSFANIYIAPVDTSHLLKSSWSNHLGPKSEIDIKKDSRLMASYVRKSFQKALRRLQEPKRKLVDNPNRKSLIIELALVELRPTNAYINSVANVAGFFVPGSVLVSTASGAALAGGVAALAAGSVAIEGRLRSAESGETIAMFADRRTDKIAPIDLAGLTWYSHAHDEINDWAEEVREWLSTPSNHRVSEPSQFTLMPW